MRRKLVGKSSPKGMFFSVGMEPVKILEYFSRFSHVLLAFLSEKGYIEGGFFSNIEDRHAKQLSPDLQTIHQGKKD